MGVCWLFASSASCCFVSVISRTFLSSQASLPVLVPRDLSRHFAKSRSLARLLSLPFLKATPGYFRTLAATYAKGCMRFDARTAKQLAPGTHLTNEGSTGLRLVASTSRRSCVYRCRSPIDARMRQVKIGEWPAMSVAAGAEWERLRAGRYTGNDPALERRCASLPNGRMVSHTASPIVREIGRIPWETACRKSSRNPGNARSLGAGVVELKIDLRSLSGSNRLLTVPADQVKIPVAKLTHVHWIAPGCYWLSCLPPKLTKDCGRCQRRCRYIQPYDR